MVSEIKVCHVTYEVKGWAKPKTANYVYAGERNKEDAQREIAHAELKPISHIKVLMFTEIS